MHAFYSLSDYRHLTLQEDHMESQPNSEGKSLDLNNQTQLTTNEIVRDISSSPAAMAFEVVEQDSRERVLGCDLNVTQITPMVLVGRWPHLCCGDFHFSSCRSKYMPF